MTAFNLLISQSLLLMSNVMTLTCHSNEEETGGMPPRPPAYRLLLISCRHRNTRRNPYLGMALSPGDGAFDGLVCIIGQELSGG